MAIFITFQPISLDFAWDTNWWISVNIHAKQLRHLGWLILSKYMEFCQSSKSLTKLKKNWKSSKILNFWMNSINFFKNWAPCLGGREITSWLNSARWVGEGGSPCEPRCRRTRSSSPCSRRGREARRGGWPTLSTCGRLCHRTTGDGRGPRRSSCICWNSNEGW